MRSLKNKETPDILLKQFNDTQLKYVELAVQEDPRVINDNELMLKLGLSLKSLHNHLKALNFEIQGNSFTFTKEGREKLRNAVLLVENDLDRLELVLKNHKLMALKDVLEISGLSIEQYCRVIVLFNKHGKIRHQTLAPQLLERIGAEVVSKHYEHEDEFTLKILQQLTA